MDLTRRGFLKVSGVATSGALLSRFGWEQPITKVPTEELRIKYAQETTTICPYCGVGCGIIVSSKDGKVINTEGDPDSPINRGSLCSKGSSLFQLANNERRITKVMYRKPYGTKWEYKSWDWAMKKIAERIKATRDASFTEKNDKGQVVNRTTAIASVGSAAMDNEECWLYQKMLRALGLLYIEHQARLCHSSTVAALAESFGRGAMTNHWNDIANSDAILIMGSNAAENHPISFKWVTKAIERGATLISVDPRFTRTSSKAHIYAPLRSGTDIAFLGGMIKYILDNELYNKDYVLEYTNASLLVNEKFYFQDGLFSGYDEKTGKYDKATWSYQVDDKGIALQDRTLTNPNCVFQLLKKHYSRYDVATVSKITGTPVEKLLEVYQAYSETGKVGKAGTQMYAMGWTQHTVGTQIIRAMSIIQLLLGNIGVAGGGINAMRGESNVQGSTDHALLFHILPGYLKTSNASQTTLAEYLQQNTPKTKDPMSVNWWSNYPKYTVSFLKSMFGAKATKENDFGYAWLPKMNDGANYSWISLFDEMARGNIKGFFAWGMNPAVSGPNSQKTAEALGNLDWMVNVNLWETETGAFWKRPGADPKKIKTEVFLLPCAASMEKEGSITNSGRWMQWRYKAVNPPGDAMADGEMIFELFNKVRELYEKKKGAFPDPILNLKWDYAVNGKFDVHLIAKEINGYDLNTGKLILNFTKLQDDGSTSSGNWLYSGSYNENGNMAARRDNHDKSGIGLYSNWAWAWPVNRRILYNRASVDLNGQPFDKEHPVIRWDPAANEGKGGWIGDVPDGPAPPLGNREKGKYPFIMTTEGFGRLFGPGLAEGPFPEHYEPLECPVEKNLLSSVLLNPTVKRWDKMSGTKDSYAQACDPRFPFVATTYRLSEHWQTGAMTRQVPWLVELQPEMFVEISQELAKELGINNGDKVIVESARGSLQAKAIVTLRFKPFKIGETIIHEVGLPWCFGFMGLATGGSANTLTPNIGDANTMIPESKAFLVNVRKEV